MLQGEKFDEECVNILGIYQSKRDKLYSFRGSICLLLYQHLLKAFLVPLDFMRLTGGGNDRSSSGCRTEGLGGG